MSSDYPIEFVDLRKEYGQFIAVDGLNLQIKRNSFTGLLGPNGAGKSTSLKILTNLIHATSGHAYLNGADVTTDTKNALMGVGTVVETPEFYLYLTPRETFRYIGEIYGMSKESISSETHAILEKVKMSEWADKRLGTFSKGMRQRIALGLSLMNDPRIIILDEPTSGLDPRGMAEMRDGGDEGDPEEYQERQSRPHHPHVLAHDARGHRPLRQGRHDQPWETPAA